MGENITYIPGRLKSAVKGGHVTGAEDIIDDALNKTQDQLNHEMKSVTDQMVVSIGGGNISLTGDPDDIVVGGGKVPIANAVAEKLAGKENVISDLATIRSGAAAGATAYQKPGTGIPKTDLAAGVQSSLEAADAAAPQATTYTKDETDGFLASEEQRARAAEEANATDIDTIEGKIPSQASSANQLADKEFVNSSIVTATATFRGSYNLVSDLSLTTDATHAQIATALGSEIATADNNDYAFVQIPTSDETPTEIAVIERYKHNGTNWAFEYALNNSGYTAAQWAAINSGITSGLVTKLQDLPTSAGLDAMLANTPEFVEENPSETELVDEYTRLLEELYQAITDAQNAKADIIGEDNYVYHWNAATGRYENTGVYAKGDKGDPGTTDYNQLRNKPDLKAVAVTGSYNDLTQKPVIPDELADLQEDAAHRTVSDTEKGTWNGKYSKPDYGIPKSDLSSGVQTSLGKADTALQEHQNLTPITEVIPEQASSSNQLADKDFVNSSIATATATFKGTYNLVSDLHLSLESHPSTIPPALETAIGGEDNNDYCFVQIPTSDATPTEIARIDRYKYNGSAWGYEYSLNNSSFTASQWAAINSNITSALVTAYSAHVANTDIHVTTQNKSDWNAKYDKPSGGIPKTDMAAAVQTSLGKADTAVQPSDITNDIAFVEDNTDTFPF